MNYSAAAERNQQVIFEHLVPWFNRLRGVEPLVHCLEIASGTGQHSAYFSSRCPYLIMQPSDQNLIQQESVAQWAQELNVSDQVKPLITLDVTMSTVSWPQTVFPIIFCANMVHISPWSASVGLFAGAGQHLVSDGILVIYGPYRFEGLPLAASNLAFDQSLKSRDPRWGIRKIKDLDYLATEANLERIATHICPANNHVLVYQKKN